MYGHDAAAVTGAGMVSSLGLDAANACAAARAGLVRPSELNYFGVRSPDDGVIEPAVGHSVPLLTHGFEGNARLIRLMSGALKNLLRSAELEDSTPHTAFYLCLPGSDRLETGEVLRLQQTEEDDEPEPFSEDDDPVEAEDADPPGEAGDSGDDDDDDDESDAGVEPRLEAPFPARAEDMLRRSVELSQWPGPVSLHALSAAGNAGFGDVLMRAIEDVTSGDVPLAVVGGADSFLDETTLMWLEDTGRLKSPATPAGLQPGEAAAFVLLESARGRILRGSRPVAAAVHVTTGLEEDSLIEGRVSKGRVLARLLAESAEWADWRDDGCAWIVADHNGEEYRALEWGNAIVTVLAKNPAFRSPVLWQPAASFGHTGAASAAVAMAVVISAFLRGYAPAGAAAIVSSSDGAQRSSIVVRRSEVVSGG